MSLFHKSTEESTHGVRFGAEEGVIALLYLAVMADGKMAPEEEELVIAASNRMKLLRRLGIADFNRAAHAVRTAFAESGQEAVLAAALAALPAELNQTLYTLAADVTFADGTATAGETAFLRKLQESLGVTDELATKVVEVMRLKNGG